MMALVFGDLTDSIHKIERLFEIGKAELTVDVVLIGHGPLGNTCVQVFQFFPTKWRYATSAGHAIFVS